MSRAPKQQDRRRLVGVVVDDSDACLARVLLAAREAGRRKLPLDLIQAHPADQATRGQRARQMERLDTALDIARRAVPGLDVRTYSETPSPAHH